MPPIHGSVAGILCPGTMQVKRPGFAITVPRTRSAAAPNASWSMCRRPGGNRLSSSANHHSSSALIPGLVERSNPSWWKRSMSVGADLGQSP
jgi:hypothetical protein